MSMLAEPRRKQKFTLNPRGKHWSEDPNKFGQKMLEKMGWSVGKGLGVNEQGMTEHVRVKVKNDQVGIGYQKDKDDHWTEHQDDFNRFLQNLQKEEGGNIEDAKNNNKILSGKSLEEKSKHSQKRVHYKKFTRGKDVNKYSTKDLANIFGKKDLNESAVKEENVEEENVNDPIGSKETTINILNVSSGNMDDHLRKKSNICHQNGASQVKKEPNDDYKICVGFSYSTKPTSKFYVNNNDDHEECKFESESEKYVGLGFTKNNESKSKIKKHMNLNYIYDNPCLDLNILDDSSIPKTIVPNVIDLEYSKNTTTKKRKSDFSYDNQGLNINCPDRYTPKKHKSENSYEKEGSNIGLFEGQVNVKNKCNRNIYEVTENSSESLEKQKFKKSKKIKNESVSNGIENPALDLNAPDRYLAQSSTVKCESVSPVSNSSMQIDGSIGAKNKPRIIKYEIISNNFSNLGLDLNYTNKSMCNKTMEVEVEAHENLALDISEKPTPKNNREIKMKSMDLFNAFDNTGLDENFLSPKKIEIENGFCNPGLDLNFPDKLTLKKCKKAKKESIAFNVQENLGLELEDKPTLKELKRNKDSQVLSNGIENPGLDLDKPTPKKSKKGKNLSNTSNEFDNPNLEVSSHTNHFYNSMNYEVSSTSTGVENNALDLSDEDSCKKRVTFNDQLEYNTDAMKKKKKKKKNVLDKYEVVTDKLKKKHKHAVLESEKFFINEGLDLHIKDEEEIENEINERKSRKSKIRKERRMLLLETIEEAPEEENSNEVPNMKNEVSDNKEVVVINEIPCETESEDMSARKSKKKKKAKKDLLKITEKIEVSTKSIDKKKIKNALEADPMETVEVNSPEKIKKDKANKTDDKKTKESLYHNDDRISLKEFLHEEEVSKLKQKKKKSTDNEKCAESEKTEVIMTEENNDSSQHFRKTKQVMKSWFSKNPTLLFTGSNINEIKGYGSQFYSNY
ncbi:uncharacterized protein LOC131666552 [Phymastichus coffea]|uniref:uncharacterized protein LOC131666552 n=1 Tax=Phymastichus coffea TaxID=108790 RepID=UPI00273B4AEA|nr:uncharacterized protein LOC131666552 [Phymastichus coffea]